MVWIFLEGKEVPFPAGQWFKLPRAFVIPLYIISRGGQSQLAFLKHFPLCIAWHWIPSFKSWRAEEVPLWIWKGKIFRHPHGFYCPSPIPVRDNHIFGCFKYKSKTTPKVLCRITISSYAVSWRKRQGEGYPKATSGLGYWGGRGLLRKGDWMEVTKTEE